MVAKLDGISTFSLCWVVDRSDTTLLIYGLVYPGAMVTGYTILDIQKLGKHIKVTHPMMYEVRCE